jgi:hypothetical protein
LASALGLAALAAPLAAFSWDLAFETLVKATLTVLALAA